MATITGNETGNVYGGTSDTDIIYGVGGNDTLSNTEGLDSLFGGDDNDSLSLGVDGAEGHGDYGDDSIFATSGASGFGDKGSDILTGDGNLFGGLSDDQIYGGALRGGSAGDWGSVSGGDGNDQIRSVAYTIYGDAGDDTI